MIKRLIMRLAHDSGLLALLRLRNRDKVSVLMYHGVMPDDVVEAEGDWLQVRASAFRAQMQYLKRYYHVCSLAEALAEIGKPSPKPRVVVTFDDGYRNNFEAAFPILRELGIPATIFVVTRMINSERLFWWDRLAFTWRKYMRDMQLVVGLLDPYEDDKADPRVDADARNPSASAPNNASANNPILAANQGVTIMQDLIEELKRHEPNEIERRVDAYILELGVALPDDKIHTYHILESGQIAEMVASGLIEIGSHTQYHQILTSMDDSAAASTILGSINDLKSLGIHPRFFAPPNGLLDDCHIPLLRQLGFTASLGTDSRVWRSSDDVYRIPRLGVGRTTDDLAFACLVAGFPVWAKSAVRQAAAWFIGIITLGYVLLTDRGVFLK